MSQKQNLSRKSKYLNGRWTSSQCERFIKGYEKFGRDWLQIQKFVKTRSLTQIRSHAQKVLLKRQNNGLDPNSDQQGSECIQYEDSSQSLQISSEIAQIKIEDYKKQQIALKKLQQSSQSYEEENKDKFRSCSTNTNYTEHHIDETMQKIKTINATFPRKTSLDKYIKQSKRPSHFMLCLTEMWDHFAKGGNFLQFPVITQSYQKN